MKQPHTLYSCWEYQYQLASTDPSEAEPIESLLVFLVMVESCGWRKLGHAPSPYLVLPEVIPHLPNSFNLCLDVQMDGLGPKRKCRCPGTASWSTSMPVCFAATSISLCQSLLRSSLSGLPSYLLRSLSILHGRTQ